MFHTTQMAGMEEYKLFFVWLVSLLLVVFGFRYLRELIVFILEKLYEFFIQQTPEGI